jgi:Flp pilus assembly protein TadG
MTCTREFIKQTGGAAAVIIALILVVLIGMASLAIDMGQLYTVRNQLQNVADAAALAGVAQLVQDQNGEAVRNSDLAHQAALQVAQSQSNLDGLPSVAEGSRNDLTIHFGVWDIYAGNPSTAWIDLGTSVPSNSNAYACYTMPPPETYIRTFVNADITGVTYSSSGNEGRYSYPKTINGVTSINKKDFLERYPDSVWNVNTLTIKNVTDASTVSPPGSISGGPPNNQVNQGALANVGPIATIPRLVQ